MDQGPMESQAGAQPPSEVRFVAVAAEPYPDRRRIRLSYEVTPFLQRPSVEIRLLDAEGRQLGSVTVVDVMGPRFSLTAHLRTAPASLASVRVVSSLGYDDLPAVDLHELSVDLPEPGRPTVP